MENLSRILLGVVFSGLLIALIQGGWTGHNGALQWYKAKFLGQPESGSTPTAAAAVTSSTPLLPRVALAPTAAATPTATATAPTVSYATGQAISQQFLQEQSAINTYLRSHGLG
jgi:hypothetical protein